MTTFTPELLQRLRGIVESGTPLARNTVLGLIERVVESDGAERERENTSRLNRDLIRDCANLTTRAETAEHRNKGILAELSASGGRNIDLRQRAEAAEAAVARVQALCKTTDGEWLDPEDECNNVGSILQAVRGGGA